MIDYFKKVVAIKNETESHSGIKGLVIVESVENKTTLNFNFSSKLDRDYTLLICGENNEIKVENITATNKFKICYENFKVNLGLTVAIFVESELVCYGKYGRSFYDLNGITSYAKKNFKKNGKEQNFKAEKDTVCYEEKPTDYDDERIAEENYYELNDERKSLHNQDATLHQTTKKEETVEENENEFGKYEENTRTFKGCDFYEKIKDKLSEIFANYESCNDLNETLPNAKFVKIQYSENKFYYVGEIYEDSIVKYVCYGVMGYYNEMPSELLENFSFIPISNFELSGKGFYLIFQDAKTGEIIKKQE